MQKMFNRGFTLIELLVVIAIIGILASVVLASLNSARSKGADASAQTSLSQARAEAEIGFSGGTYRANLCTDTTNPGGIGTLVNAASNQVTGTAVCDENVPAAPTAWGAAVDLSTGSSFCVDSTGFAGSSSVAAATEISTDGSDVVCNNL